jgi:5-methylcytosine-specific restriction endonuclease McrA
LKKNGKTYQEIYSIINGKVVKEKIRLLCNKNGLSYFGRLNEDEINNIQHLYEELKNIREISRLTGYSRDTIKSYIKINKLTPDEIKKNRSNSVVSWRQRTKIKLMEHKGGCCQICSYKRSIGALEFHHIDPNEKDFSISGKSYSFERLKKEVDKCILVCSNCHIEIHEEIKKFGYSEIVNTLGV